MNVSNRLIFFVEFFLIHTAELQELTQFMYPNRILCLFLAWQGLEGLQNKNLPTFANHSHAKYNLKFKRIIA